MPTISEEILNETVSMIRGHLMDYAEDIEKAYCGQDNSLSIGLKAKFTPESGGVRIDTGIDFVLEKIKDSSSKTIGDQPDLPFT